MPDVLVNTEPREAGVAPGILFAFVNGPFQNAEVDPVVLIQVQDHRTRGSRCAYAISHSGDNFIIVPHQADSKRNEYKIQ